MGDLSGPLIAAGDHTFLWDWSPGNQPASFAFDIEGDGTVRSFHWGFRPFVRVDRPN